MRATEKLGREVKDDEHTPQRVCTFIPRFSPRGAIDDNCFAAIDRAPFKGEA